MSLWNGDWKFNTDPQSPSNKLFDDDDDHDDDSHHLYSTLSKVLGPQMSGITHLPKR